MVVAKLKALERVARTLAECDPIADASFENGERDAWGVEQAVGIELIVALITCCASDTDTWSRSVVEERLVR